MSHGAAMSLSRSDQVRLRGEDNGYIRRGYGGTMLEDDSLHGVFTKVKHIIFGGCNACIS